jgi:hypothetical protein
VGPGRFRFFVGVLVCVALPLGSKVFAGGALAYTMYAATVVYRVELAAHDDRGRSWPIAPTDLARFTGPSAAPFLFGAEKARELPQINALRAHLADVGRVACAHASATTVDVTLFEGDDATALTVRTVSIMCGRAP